MHDWLDDRGFRFSADQAVFRGGHDVWSVSDGVTVALLRVERDADGLRAPGRRGARSPPIRAAAARRHARRALLGAHEPWTPQLDLLGSDGDAPEFVVEVEHDGAATLRFGDGVHGRRPDTGTVFEATYRVGNGVAGNVGTGAIAHIAKSGGGVTGVDNPLPAVRRRRSGGARRNPPRRARGVPLPAARGHGGRLRGGQRAQPDVQRARATFRWTGSWHTVFVTADAAGGGAVDAAFETGLRGHLEPFRWATTSRSTRRASCRSGSRSTSASSRTSSART